MVKKILAIILIISISILGTSCIKKTIQVYDGAKDEAKITADNTNVLIINSAISMYESMTNTKIPDGPILPSSKLITSGYLKVSPNDPWEQNRVYSIKNGKALPLGAPK